MLRIFSKAILLLTDGSADETVGGSGHDNKQAVAVSLKLERDRLILFLSSGYLWAAAAKVCFM